MRLVYQEIFTIPNLLLHHIPSQQQYIDIEAMCKSLHGKYPEYNRKKFRVFKEQVETAFQKLLSGGAPTSRELIDIPDVLWL